MLDQEAEAQALSTGPAFAAASGVVFGPRHSQQVESLVVLISAFATCIVEEGPPADPP